jgi:hypothetical protein
VLKGVVAVVFVADSSRGKLDENLESLRNLEQNLNEHGMSLDEIPWVIQYNKRDAADAMAVPDLDARLNPLRVPSYEAVATMGRGVYETFHGIATLVYRVLKERLEKDDVAAHTAAAPARPVPARAAAGERDEYDIDSMLREMDAPALHAAPQAAPAAPGSAHGKVSVAATAPAPPPPARPVPTAAAAPSPSPAAARPEPAVAAQKQSLADSGVFNRSPESFDLELGRLPALEDAAFASEHARHQGPNEFVTDPMRRPLAVDHTPPDHVEAPPAPSTVTVPVVLTRAQIQPGVAIRVVLEIRVKDE